jgi:hypothetical protein
MTIEQVLLAIDTLNRVMLTVGMSDETKSIAEIRIEELIKMIK